MRLEGRQRRSLRHALVGLANGVSLLFLAVLVAAYGSGTAIPFESAEEFLRVAKAWARGPRGPTLAWTLGYIGAAVLILSSVWFLLVGSAVRGLLDLEFSTAPAERREGDNEVTEDEETRGDSATTVDETETGAIRGGSVDGDVKTFTIEDVSGDEESESVDRGV